MTKKQQVIGKGGEERAANTLRSLGIRMVEKIGTPVRLIPAKQPNTYFVIWGDKVSGDHHGIIPYTGRYVLAETKTMLDHNLRWSDLREHQPERLSEHANLGGLSLLVWVHSDGIYVMQWPIPGFQSGKSIDRETATALDLKTRECLEEEVCHA